MSIQGNIIQGISLVGLLASQNPALKEKQEHAAKVKRATSQYNKAIEAENAALEEYQANIEKVEGNEKLTRQEKDASILNDPTYELYETAGKNVLDAQEQMFALDPSAENAKGILARKREISEQKDIVAEARAEAAKRDQEELERLAFNRQVLEGVYGPSTDIPERAAAQRKREAAAKKPTGGDT